jgi:hypothetical protein
VLPELPARLVGRAASRLLAAVLGESPAARAAHQRTRPRGTVQGRAAAIYDGAGV